MKQWFGIYNELMFRIWLCQTFLPHLSKMLENKNSFKFKTKEIKKILNVY